MAEFVTGRCREVPERCSAESELLLGLGLRWRLRALAAFLSRRGADKSSSLLVSISASLLRVLLRAPPPRADWLARACSLSSSSDSFRPCVKWSSSAVPGGSPRAVRSATISFRRRWDAGAGGGSGRWVHDPWVLGRQPR